MEEGSNGDIRDVNARRNVSLLARKVLEDKYLCLMEEIFLLKKHSRLQEDKMKKMATKLLKLSSGNKDKGRGDMDTEEQRIEVVLAKVKRLEEENASLRNKVVVLRIQQDSGWRPPHDHAPSTHRSQPGGVKASPVRGRGTGVWAGSTGTQTGSPGQQQYGHSLLNDARKDNLLLESAVLELKESLAGLVYKMERAQEEHSERESELVEESRALRGRVASLMEDQKRSAIAEDVECIRLQRQVRAQASSVTALQVRQQGLERQLQAAHLQNASLLAEMERLQDKAKETVSTKIEAESQNSNSVVSSKALVELEEMVQDLRREKDVLKQSNDRLIQASMDDSRTALLQTQLTALQKRVLSTEEEMAVRATQVNDVCEKLASEKVVSEALRNEAAMLKAQLSALHQQRSSLDDKIKLLSKGAGSGRLDARHVEAAPGSVVPPHPGPGSSSQAVVVKSLRTELQDRLKQISDLHQQVSSHRSASLQCAEQLRQAASDRARAQGSARDRGSQTARVERVSSSVQTHTTLVSPRCVGVQTVGLQTRRADAQVQTSDWPAAQTTPSPAHQTTPQVSHTPAPGADDSVVMERMVLHSPAQSSGARTLAIGIHSLSILANSSVGRDSCVARLFVEYEFLTFDTNDLETPMSLWKPSNGQRMVFNFRQTFSFDPVDNKDVCHELRQALHSSNPTDCLITFTVVCDPEEADGECREVGTTGLAVQDVLEEKGESLHVNLPVLAVQDLTQQEVIGQLEISIEGLNIINYSTTI